MAYRWLRSCIVVVCLSLALGGAGCQLPVRTEKPQNQKETADQSFSYNDLYRKVSPSVVTVYSNFGPEMLFDENAGAGSGSGVIFRKDGHIITNYHVVSDDNLNLKSSVEVALSNEKTYVAKIVGIDPLNDIAIIKIEENDLPTSELGTIKDLKVGDPIFVIGSPGARAGLMLSTLTTGIVSAKNRTYQGWVRLQPNLVQIDAAINPGNSGGPVYNAEGKVIGIATLRDPETQNIGFAVPIDVAKRSADEIIKTGSLKSGWIGVDTITLNKVVARAYQFDAGQGAVVVYVYFGGPAAKGAVQRGDVITEVDGKKLKSNSQLEDILLKKKIDDTVELKMNRFGEEMSVNLVVEEVPSGKLE